MAVLLIGLTITAAVAVLRFQQAHVRTEEHFEQSADQARATVETELAHYVDRLQDLGTFLIVDGRPTSAEFERFVTGSDFFGQLEPLSGVIVLERVENDDVAQFVEEVRPQLPDMTFIELGPPPPGAARYLITYFVNGDLEVEIPVGVDVSAIESVRAELEVRSRTGRVAAGAIQNDPLVRDLTAQFDSSMVDGLLGQLDFIIAVPVYRAGESPEAGAPPANWVAATVNDFDAVLERPFTATGGQLGANLTVRIDNPDVTAVDVERVAESPDPPGSLDEADFTRTDTFSVQGLELSLVTWSSPEAADEGLEAVVFTLLAGIIASLLGASVVYLRRRSLNRERALGELRAESERAQLRSDILTSVTDAVVVLDGEGHIVTVNPAWDRLREREPSNHEPAGPDDGRRYIDVLRELSPLGAESVGWALAEVLTGETESAEADVPVDLGGRRLWKAVSVATLHGASGGAVVVHRDITRRKESEASLTKLARQDPLTGLLNRASFEDAARLAVGRARETGAPVGALFIDLDDFKQVNDTYNHAVGDGVLKAVAKRISNAVRADDAVARHGGDEFVVLLRELPDPGTADVTAGRILQSLQEPIAIGDIELVVGASIGVVVLSERTEMSVAALLSLSDQAMYEAKGRGGSMFVKVG